MQDIDSHTSIKYRPEIDGLRCIAVLAVIFYHAKISFISGGYVGVDIFFVISGFLITGIILKESAANTFTLKSFYERRMRRILPALFVVSAVSLPICLYVTIPRQMEEFSQSLIATFLFVSNFFFYTKDNYFDANAEHKPLLHTWTLSLEEQFYIFFPIFLLFAWRIGAPRLLWTFMTLALLSLGFSELLVSHGQKAANFFLLPTRVWEFLAGSIIATLEFKNLHSNANTIIKNVSSLIGLALIIGAILFFNEQTPFPGLWALLPVTGTALIINFSKDTVVSRILSIKIMTGLGLISYSAYLWHQPLFVMTRIYQADNLTAPTTCMLLFIILVLSWLTWKYVEQPFRKKRNFSRSQLFIFGLIGSLAFIITGSAGYATGGFQKIYYARLSPNQAQEYNMIERAIVTNGYEAMYDNKECKFWDESLSKSFIDRFDECQKKYKKAIFVIGDSHAMDLYNAMAMNSKTPFVASVSLGACPIHATFENCPYKNFANFVKEKKLGIDHVFYTQSGLPLVGTNRDTLNRDYVEKISDYLSVIQNDVPVMWLGPQVELTKGISHYNILKAEITLPLATNNIYEVDKALKLINSHSSFKFISKIDLIKYNYKNDFIKGGNITYSDKDHWSTYGEKEFGKRLLKDKTIKQALGNNL